MMKRRNPLIGCRKGSPPRQRSSTSEGPEVGRVWLMEEREQELGVSRKCMGPGEQQGLARLHLASLSRMMTSLTEWFSAE